MRLLSDVFFPLFSFFGRKTQTFVFGNQCILGNFQQILLLEIWHAFRCSSSIRIGLAGLGSSRVEDFCWLGKVGKVSTIDNLKGRGCNLQKHSRYMLFSGKAMELINYV